MTLVRFDEVALEFGDQVLLREASMSIEPGERVCLIGRNGAGKTSLFRLITGELETDQGEIHLRPGIGISQLKQNLPDDYERTVREVVTDGLAEARSLAENYRQLTAKTADTQNLRELEALHQQIDARGGWNIEQRVDKTLSELDLPAEMKLANMSGGWRRRVALAKALVSRPDLLLLDEPTNHLDLATIDWLESRINNWPGAVVFITHDRAFLQRLATRILEIDRTRLISWECDYHTYLKRKDKALQDEQEHNARFDKKLAEEEAWIRQGIKARRTRNEGRVRQLQTMREEFAGRIKRQPGAHISIDEAEQSGRKVIRMKNASYAYDETTNVINNLSLQVIRGNRIGLVGNNGVGKSTLLKLMLGELQPDTGTIKHGTNLEIAYFDQLQRELDPNRSVADIVGDGRDYITINGKERHVVGYLRGFLFSAKRAMTPAGVLSGGERNRVILAKLFTRPSNLLVLDEPTNDLDVETLEVLEARLAEYAGTLIVVSHDREFLDNVVTSILVFEDDGKIHEYVGGYSDWIRRGHQLADTDKPADKNKNRQTHTQKQDAETPTKLSYKQQRELDILPKEIEALETRVKELETETGNQNFYSRPYEETQPVLDELLATREQLETMTHRWLELEEKQQAFIKTKQKGR